MIVVYILLALTLHELAHFFVATLLRVPVIEINILGYAKNPFFNLGKLSVGWFPSGFVHCKQSTVANSIAIAAAGPLCSATISVLSNNPTWAKINFVNFVLTAAPIAGTDMANIVKNLFAKKFFLAFRKSKQMDLYQFIKFTREQKFKLVNDHSSGTALNILQVYWYYYRFKFSKQKMKTSFFAYNQFSINGKLVITELCQ